MSETGPCPKCGQPCVCVCPTVEVGNREYFSERPSVSKAKGGPEVHIGRHRAVEIEQYRWDPDEFAASLLDDVGEVVAFATGETPSKALRALALMETPDAPDRPSLAGMRRREMAPRDSEERVRMVWAFNEATRRMRKVMKHAGFEVMTLLGVLGDEAMAQRCIPRPVACPDHSGAFCPRCDGSGLGSSEGRSDE